MIKRSKSKESTVLGGSQTQRISPNAILTQNTEVVQQEVQGQNGASKSIFNHTQKELKPCKSMDLTSSLVDGMPTGSVGGTVNSMINEDNDNLDLYLFRPSEKVE